MRSRKTAAAMIFVVLAAFLGAVPALAVDFDRELFFTVKASKLTAGKSYTFRFALFGQQSGGQEVWFERKTLKVPANLVVSHKLGSVRPFALGDSNVNPVPVDFSQQLWLEVLAGTKIVGTGRTKFGAAPYALWSDGSASAALLSMPCPDGSTLVYRTGTGWQCGLVCTCPSGQTDCSGLCIDIMTDRANCGGCGIACPGGEICTSGQCALSCGGGATKCGSACVDTDLDPLNCGGCGTACSADQVCSAGACTLQCVGGSTKCGAACVDTKVDYANCGGCAKMCLSGSRCVGMVCVLTCQAGQTVCSASCINLLRDNANCGACGVVCPLGKGCVSGVCQ